MNTEPKRFLIIGAGGIGGHLLRGLLPMVEYRRPGSMVMVVDGDSFEDKNRERQDFDVIGNKAEVLAASYARRYPQTFLVPLPAWVVADDHPGATDANGGDPGTRIAASALLDEGDVVYAVVDNFKCRKDLLDAAARLDDVDVFCGGNDEEFFGSVLHYRRRDGRDVTEPPAFRHPEYETPGDRNPGELSCEERARLEGGTQLLVTNMAVAMFMLAATQRHIIDDHEPDRSELYFDLATGALATYDRREDAPVPAVVATD